MAKIERQFSRAGAAVADGEAFDEVFRSHAVQRPRPLSSLEEVVGDARSGVGPDEDDELPVLRTRSRVQVKRGRIPSGRLGRILVVCAIVAALCVVLVAVLAVHNFFMQDARFRIETASSIQVLGNSEVTRPELLSVFGEDIGRNIFHVPLAVRRAELEQLPWVEHATVMRLLPNQLRVAVTERVPVAFVRAGSRIGLVDPHGVLLEMPPAMMAAKHYSFPVVNGITAAQRPEERLQRMQLYSEFMNALSGPTADSATAWGQLSEVDLSDPEDVRVLLPSAGSDLLVHFGSEDFAARWARLEQKLPGWRQQYPRLAGVDLRYQRQTVLEMAKPAVEDAAAEGPAAAPGHNGDSIPSARATSSRPARARKPNVIPAAHPRAVLKRPFHSYSAISPGARP